MGKGHVCADSCPLCGKPKGDPACAGPYLALLHKQSGCPGVFPPATNAPEVAPRETPTPSPSAQQAAEPHGTSPLCATEGQRAGGTGQGISPDATRRPDVAHGETGFLGEQVHSPDEKMAMPTLEPPLKVRISGCDCLRRWLAAGNVPRPGSVVPCRHVVPKASPEPPPALTEAELLTMETRATEAEANYYGMVATLAGYVLRLLGEVARLRQH